MLLYIIIILAIVRVGIRFFRQKGHELKHVPYAEYKNAYVAIGAGNEKFTEMVNADKELSPGWLRLVLIFRYFLCLLFVHMFSSSNLTVLYGNEGNIGYEKIGEDLYLKGVKYVSCSCCGMAKKLNVQDGVTYWQIKEKIEQIST